MGLITRALERRAISYQSVWGTGGDWAPVTEAGVSVSQKSALGITTAQACVSLLVDTVSTLPVRTLTRPTPDTTAAVPRPAWMWQPEADNPSSTWEGHVAEVMFSLLLDGNAFVLTVRDGSGEVVEVRALDPTRVTPRRDADRRIVYDVQTDAGGMRALDDTMVRHLWRLRRPGDLRGLSPIELARRSLGKHMAAEVFGARFFGSGATLSGVIQAKTPMTQQSADDLKAKFAARHAGIGNAFDVGVLDNGAEWKPLTVTPEQAQFLATLEKGDEDVARLFRVPPPLAGITKPGAMAYASVDALMIAFEKFTVRPYVELLETSYRPLLPPGVFVTFNTDGLLRGDFKTRMEGYAVAVDRGIVTRAEVRRREDFAPLEGADVPMVPLNMSDPETASLGQRIAALDRLVRAGFEPAAAAAAVGLPPIAHTGLIPTSVYPEVQP